jgi:hypothetical protein
LVKASDLWDKRVLLLQVTNTTEQTIELRTLMSASSSSRAFDLRCYIRENLLTFIQTNYPESLPETRVVINIGNPKLENSAVALKEVSKISDKTLL